MKKQLQKLARAALVFGSVGWAASAAMAQEFRLESASLPIPLIENGKVDTVIEASAVEPIGDGKRLLVAHDKHPALFVVETATGRILGEPITSAKFPTPSSLGGPKWEGMARDSEGNLLPDRRSRGQDRGRNGRQERAAAIPHQRGRFTGHRRCLGPLLARPPLARDKHEERGIACGEGRQAQDRGLIDPRIQERRRLTQARAFDRPASPD